MTSRIDSGSRTGVEWDAPTREAEQGTPAGLLLPDHADARTQKLFRAFVADGRLTGLPAKHGKQLVILDIVAQRFEPGRRYPEVEVNAILREVYDDYVTLRRLLVDDDFLSREQGSYWRSGGSVEV